MDEFAHSYVIFVIILFTTLTKLDTLIIQNKLRILCNAFQNLQKNLIRQNKLRILRNGFQNSQNP